MTAYAGASISRAPPQLPISAFTPRDSPFRATRSMNGPGKVFSRPTSTPTTFIAASYERVDHLGPVGPVVRPAAPEVERRGHTPFLKRGHQPARVGKVRVLGTGRDVELRLPQRPEQRLVAEVRQEREWV